MKKPVILQLTTTSELHVHEAATQCSHYTTPLHCITSLASLWVHLFGGEMLHALDHLVGHGYQMLVCECLMATVVPSRPQETEKVTLTTELHNEM